MFLTIEELYLFKTQYQAEIEELERKKAVVEEFIAYAEAKDLPKSNEGEAEENEEPETEVVGETTNF